MFRSLLRNSDNCELTPKLDTHFGHPFWTHNIASDVAGGHTLLFFLKGHGLRPLRPELDGQDLVQIH
jgi:hypothetical protein